MTVVALVSDLIFGSRILATAKAAGARAVTVRTAEQFKSALAEGATLALVDMDVTHEAEACLTAARERTPPVPVVAFVSHVRADLAEAARKAGAAQVLSRSMFTNALPRLLSGAEMFPPQDR